MVNLLSDGWLTPTPLLRTRGKGSAAGSGLSEVGVRDLLFDAGKYADVVVDLPTQKPAIFRQVLLPLVVDALGWPASAAEWTSMFRAGEFSASHREKLADYMERHHHLFGLFDADAPFAQVAELRTARSETKGSALLVPTAATGNNVPLFSSRTEGDPLELTPAQAARWLLHTHCWDTAAIKTGAVGDPRVKAGKTTGNPTGPLGQLGVTMPVGTTLFETLMLNIPYGLSALSDDRPQWRRRDMRGETPNVSSCATAAWQERPAAGLLDLWTWQARRIRLFAEQTPAGVRVSRVLVAAGDRLELSTDLEPHTAWRIDSGAARARKTAVGRKSSSTDKLPVKRPRRHDIGHVGWRGLGTLLAVKALDQDRPATATRDGALSSLLLQQLSEVTRCLPHTYPLRVELTGITYGNQSAVVEDIYSDDVPLPVAALDPGSDIYGRLLEAVGQADELAQAVNLLSADLRRALGAEPIAWDRGQRPGETLLHALDPVVRRLLVGLRMVGDDDFDLCERGMCAWETKAGQAAWTVAESLFTAVPVAAFAGRRTKKDGKEQVHRLGTAEAAFRRRLAVVLHRRAAARRAS